MLDGSIPVAVPASGRVASGRGAMLLHHGVVALVLGFPLSIALSGVLHRSMLLLGAGPVAGQLTMWAVYPVWMTAMALVFMVRSRRACWAWLSAANLVAGAAFYALAMVAGSAA